MDTSALDLVAGRADDACRLLVTLAPSRPHMGDAYGMKPDTIPGFAEVGSGKCMSVYGFARTHRDEDVSARETVAPHVQQRHTRVRRWSGASLAIEDQRRSGADRPEASTT